MSIPAHRDAAFIVRLAWLGAAYFAGAEAAYATPGMHAGVWLPAGIYLAGLLRTPPSRWAMVAITAGVANLAVDLMHRQSALFALAYLMINVGSPLAVAAGLVRTCRESISFQRLSHILYWGLFAGLLVGPVAALGGAALTVARHGGSFWQEWYLWWDGDLVGMLVATPLTFAILDRHKRHEPIRATETGILLSCAALATWLQFCQPFPPPVPTAVLYFFLMWAALRLGAAVVAATALVILFISLWLTLEGLGPYSELPTEPLRVQTVQLLVSIGAFLFYILAAVIAERRAAEHLLQQHTRRLDDDVRTRTLELQEAEKRLRLAMDVGDIFSWNCDVRSGRFSCSENGPRIMGIPPDLFPDDVAEATSLLPKTDAFRAKRQWNALLTGRTSTLTSEYRLSHPLDGSALWIRVHGIALDYVNGRPARIAGVGQNITSRKLEEEALHAADRRKNEFLAMLAHELRNPLAPIRNAAQLLSRHCIGYPDMREPIAMLDRQSEQLTRLVDDLLDVARIAQGRIELKREPLLVSSVIEQAVEMAMPLIRGKHQHLALKQGTELLMVDADRARLAQSIGNLLTNASKYTDPGGSIELAVSSDGDCVSIRITDDGQGISAELLPQVFGMFVQSARTLDRSQGGLGIGLSIVKRLVEMHDGSVTAASDGEGKGACFTVRLHRLTAQPGMSLERINPKIVPQRVLIVDDNADAADSTAMLLRLEGHEVKAVYGAIDALAEAHEWKPDVVFLDIGLPDMNGYDVARQMRSDPLLVGLRLIALTGYGQTTDRDHAEAAGFDAFLVKPVQMPDLAAILTGSPLSHPNDGDGCESNPDVQSIRAAGR